MKYHDEIEFDLLGLGLRLSDLWAGNLSWRLLSVVLGQLPSTSSFWRARHGSGDWSIAEHQRADLFDLLAAGNWQRAGDSKAPKPKRYPRPGEIASRESLIEKRAREFQERHGITANKGELVSRRMQRSKAR